MRIVVTVTDFRKVEVSCVGWLGHRASDDETYTFFSRKVC